MSRCNDLQVRTMRREELAFAIDLAAQEGWNPGLYDADCFFAADPSGLLIGELGGEAVGCISAVSYAGRFGFLGLYIVRPEFRGHGYGLQLWKAGIARLHGHNIGLDGVVAQQSNYVRSGFRLAYRNIRYRGEAEPAPIHATVRPAAEVPFEAICEFDRKIFPVRRDVFLRHWLAQPMARVYVARDDGRLTGYIVIRRCREGWKIGPLAADDAIIARRLYDAAAAHAPHGDAIFIDVPEANPGAKSFLSGLSLTPVFEAARMYTGPDPAIELPKLFGVTTLELG
ncbi:GNAT family N-acetyltransferase [Verrucomicrobiota bacterium sgz303538]